ncbi:MAG: NADH-quinone oxidoreductase subunit D, partial [Chloroflexota bacterium]
TGPVLRASGVRYDIRRAEPYSIYDRFDFQVPALEHGDSYDRYLLRILEMRQSVRILEQALAQIPAGEIQTRLPKAFRPAPGEAYARTESPKGELGYYVVSDGSGNPYRIKIRPPSFVNISILSRMSVGWKVADLITILGSVDIILGEVDR